MNNDMYWLWLTNIKGIGRKKIQTLLDIFEHPMNIWELDSYHINRLKFLTKQNKINLLDSKDEDRIQNYCNKLKDHQITFLSIENKDFPRSLTHIYDKPFGIYVKGKLPSFESPSIAIVGARKCSEYGRDVAKYFGRELAKIGFNVISGMARGIDTAAHIGALQGGGQTVAVLGSGVNVCYPSENRALMQEIESSGAVISELPVNAAPIAANFPLRNRIISGLSDGVLIVEAALRSGSLITADMALEQGKDVFAIPGRLMDDLSEGTHRLIRTGAKIVTCLEDIVEEYIQIDSKEYLSTKKNIELEENEKIVYSCLSLEPMFIDEIFLKTGIGINDLQHILIKLEFKELIKQLPNKYFVKVFCGG